MQEWRWHIPTADGHQIYGCTNSLESVSPDRAIILVHGLTGNMNEYHHKTAAHFFIKHKYDVIRFNLYSDMPKSRSLSACTLQTHAADLNTVLEQKAKTYRKIFLAGHSYGGPTIMIAQPRRAAVVISPVNSDAVWAVNLGLMSEKSVSTMVQQKGPPFLSGPS